MGPANLHLTQRWRALALVGELPFGVGCLPWANPEKPLAFALRANAFSHPLQLAVMIPTEIVVAWTRLCGR